jgi:hypothetical protein
MISSSQRPGRPADLLWFYCLLACVLGLGATARSQTYSVLYSFNTGYAPTAGVTIDQGGNLYGVTQYGGHSNQNCQIGCGTVYRLSYTHGTWAMTTLYSFGGGSDGAFPMARVVFGPDGALYGTTQSDWQSCDQWGDCGTVFRLQPPARSCPSSFCPWKKAILYRFSGALDGSLPGTGDLVFDHAGRIYGTTQMGGAFGGGAVYLLTPSGRSWSESVLYSFGGLDGLTPVGGVILDRSENVLGTTAYGGPGYHPPQYYGGGTIFELTPNGGGWNSTLLYSFVGDARGYVPYAALTIDNAGNLFGTSGEGGDSWCWQESEMYGGCGALFSVSGGVQELYDFPGTYELGGPAGPRAPMTADAAGNLYGTYYGNGTDSLGGIFELRARSYQYVPLHDFQPGENDGGDPVSNVVMDGAGNLYGVAGSVIWEITR